MHSQENNTLEFHPHPTQAKVDRRNHVLSAHMTGIFRLPIPEAKSLNWTCHDMNDIHRILSVLDSSSDLTSDGLQLLGRLASASRLLGHSLFSGLHDAGHPIHRWLSTFWSSFAVYSKGWNASPAASATTFYSMYSGCCT